MKLTLATRLSAFFLAAVAAILICFSAATFIAARSYLYRRMDDRLEIALDVLEASIDIEPEGMEWEPTDRRLITGAESRDQQAIWAIYDERGVIVGRSARGARDGFPPASAWSELPRLPLDATVVKELGDWRLAARTLRLTELLNPLSPRDVPGAVEDDVQHEELLLVAGLSPLPVEATLRHLLSILGGGSLFIWTICAVFGRRLASWAMAPVRKLATAAMQIEPGDHGWQLPPPGTADELDEMTTAFNQLLGRLHNSFESQRRFAGEASHQLRTPLTGILGQLDVALRRDRSPEEYQRVLSAVRDESRRLARIVESLLLLSREGPSAAFATAPGLELRNWLRSRRSQWSAHRRNGDLHWAVDPGGQIWIKADPELLGQAFDNLLENALKYSQDGTPIRVDLTSSSDFAQLAVHDCGSGISPDDLARIFHPFFRTDAARLAGQPGYGLGLPVALRIIEAYAGSLTVESVLCQGSRFVVRFPLICSEADADPPTAAALQGEN